MLVHNLLRARIPWETVFTSPISLGVIESIHTDGTYLYIQDRDSVNNVNYQDSIRTYTVNADGTLSSHSSIVLSGVSGGNNAIFNRWSGAILVGNRYYAAFTGGMISYTISGGVLTQGTTTLWRPNGQHDTYPGPFLHGKYIAAAFGKATPSATNFGYWTGDGTIDHVGPTQSGSIPSNNNDPQGFGVDNVYCTNNPAVNVSSNVQHIRISAAGAMTLINNHAFASTIRHRLLVVNNQLYFGDDINRLTFDGYFPINPDGSLGVRVDVSGTFEDPSPHFPEARRSRETVAGFLYRVEPTARNTVQVKR